MTQNPYAEPGADVFPEAERTSVMAILSLICSIICCIPGLGLLGTLLGVFALIGIGGSRGRVGGKGLAIAGIILGLLVTVIWAGAFIGFRQVYAISIGRVGQAMAEIDAGDHTAARAYFDANLNASVADADLVAFRTAYQAQMGAFIEAPDSMFAWISSFVDPSVGPQMKNYQGRNDVIPSAATFDQGTALIIGVIDQTAQSGNLLVFADMRVITPDGSEINLSDFASGQGPGAGSDAQPPAHPEAQPETQPGGDEEPGSDPAP